MTDEPSTGDSDDPPTRAELLRLAELARDLQQQVPTDLRGTLDSLTEAAAKCVPGAQYAGITIAHRQKDIETSSTTGRYPSVLDEIQRQHREGPCLSAAWDNHTIRIHDVATDSRWPRYCREALRQTPIRSVLSFQLFTTKRMSTALNFYAERAHAFDDASVDVGLAFASHMALVWNIFRREEQFRSALASRDVIGQAKGILMERFNMDAVDAFDLIRRLSQQSNTGIAEIAQRLVVAEHPPRNPLAI